MPDASIRLIDSHAHLSSPLFGAGAIEALERARVAGVSLVVDVGAEPDDWERSLRLADESPLVRCVLGLHPNSADAWSDETEQRLRGLVAHPRVVGIGETGLDYYRLGASAETQRRVFIAHLQIGRETGLPVVIHAREAYDDILEVLEAHGRDTRGVMHSFAGSVAHALRTVSLGYYVSISGPVTYKKAEALREVAAVVPLDRLLVETDSPFLPPHPHRGRRNEPAYVRLTAEAVASARGVTLEEIAEATTANALRLFGLQMESPPQAL
ncbi:MAG: TatD family hydrolase [Chloroflexota bacterium]|nr:TatD family hydrolase [Chloroflexota bacterium]